MEFLLKRFYLATQATAQDIGLTTIVDHSVMLQTMVFSSRTHLNTIQTMLKN